MYSSVLLGVLCALCCVFASNGALIENLPGLPDIPAFKQYSGYITANEQRDRRLFYWFAESQSNPAKDPLILWLTGGPGCSGLVATLGENGPYTMNIGGDSLYANEYSWNLEANVIWIESPAGVGFSTVRDPMDYDANDIKTANDTYTFLLKFIHEEFPEFVGREFWITGESYGGHYVPELALRIHEGNLENKAQINIQGFLVGNAWTHMPVDNTAAIDSWWQRALVPESTIDEIKKHCNLSNYGPLVSKRSVDNSACDNAVAKANKQMGDVSIYDIYADVCVLNDVVGAFARAGSPFHSALNKVAKTEHGLDACLTADITKYLNTPAVQEAIHADPTHWEACSQTVHYNYEDVKKSVIPVYEKLFTTNQHILVYAGDVDAIVPWLGTQRWINSINLHIKDEWRPWHDSGKQVGGYVTVYDTMTFATVRNAGHQVPYFQPERAYIMFSNWIKNARFPN
eukprot:CAMPEP_0168516210 /NCGR_PEP_ID=MMETSP0405-20121227/5268_1 /TAXON_ID=498012 /ORGANISM="Trichosphaerium sp, Strain Am-I-7 wt" /LENGTH=457 /DNA_ID=CAMNT_0008535881 /DNA_START=968 /DNA_END=2341 /DNA_ORIENTATION=+